MKKTLIVLLLTITILPCFSQYSLGVKGGIHYKKISDNVGVLNTDMILGYDLGFFGKFEKSEKFYLKSELLLSDQLYTIQINKINRNSGFITTTVLLGYNILNGKLFKFSAFSGIEINFTLNTPGLYFAEIRSGPVLEYGKPVFLGVSFGTGFEVSRFTFDTRYSYGYALNPEHELYKNLRINNHYIKISTGWKFLNKIAY